MTIAPRNPATANRPHDTGVSPPEGRARRFAVVAYVPRTPRW